jgi:hypothetical protein
MLRRLLAGVGLLVAVAVLWSAFSAYPASARFVRADREAMNLASRQPAATARQTCAGMSRFSHVDGLTDGNFMLPGFMGSSYFYRSMCFQGLAVSSADAALCGEVWRRPTLLGRDAGVSEASCRAQVAQAMQVREVNARLAGARARSLAGIASIVETTVTKAGPDTWLASALVRGELAGEYEFTITAARKKFSETDTLGLLYRETAWLGVGENRRYWTLTRDQLFRALDADARPGRLYNIAVGMSYLKPAQDGLAAERVGAGVGTASVDDR